MIEHLLSDNHGIVRRAQLIAAGVTPEEIRRLLSVGALLPCVHGWYATPTADDQATRAIRAGGALTCLSALTAHRVWTPPTFVLHVRRTRHRSNKKLPPGIKDCQPRHGHRTRVTRPVDSVGQALLGVLNCVDSEYAVAVLDSVLNRRLLTMTDLEQLFEHETLAHRSLLDRVDGRAESGTESLVRRRLDRWRIKHRVQVQIAGVGRVDLLIGERLVIEVDSVLHHTSASSYRNDRTRDRRLVALGYVVVRLTYEDVMDNWAEAEQQILALIRAGRHRRPLIV